MRFSLGSVLLFVTGAALIAFAGTLGSHLLVTTFEKKKDRHNWLMGGWGFGKFGGLLGISS